MGSGPPLAPGGWETNTGHNVQKCLPGQAQWDVLVLLSSWLVVLPSSTICWTPQAL